MQQWNRYESSSRKIAISNVSRMYAEVFKCPKNVYEHIIFTYSFDRPNLDRAYLLQRMFRMKTIENISLRKRNHENSRNMI